ncbi:TylF/MycF/NovP-related O-methyltransferase [Variovorax sp. VNK109]|uniref:TylF/MycF/NovP-related O-methyltransferase n=1 Tax=Variovorax sp. VNK109 TaxID=3400919 RepID=UPI003C096AC6
MMLKLREIVRRTFRFFGLEVRRVSAPGSRYEKNVMYEADVRYHELRAKGLAMTGSPDGKIRSIEKQYNTIQFLRLVVAMKGSIAECGAFKGLGSFMFCHTLRQSDPSYDGKDFLIFDSFEGLSEPVAQDVIEDARVGSAGQAYMGAGSFHGGLEHVRHALREFPAIEFHQGWIPASFKDLRERQYRFVHIDVDLYEPTRDSLEYFYPRLCEGGVIVCDDYAHLHWPGARKALDEYCHPRGIPVLCLTTGQGVIIKRESLGG